MAPVKEKQTIRPSDIVSIDPILGGPPLHADPALVKEAIDQNTKELTVGISDDMFAADSGNKFSAKDMAIPFLSILQDGSPQVKRRESKYIEGADAGMFFNTVTKQIWPGTEKQGLDLGVKPGLIVIPVYYTPSVTEWMAGRQGFVADHGTDDSALATTTKGPKKEDILPNGNILVIAGMYYLFLYDEATGDVIQVAYSMSSTARKVSRKWNTNIQSLRVRLGNGMVINPAKYYMAYRLTAITQTREDQSWFIPEITNYKPTVDLGPTGPAIYKMAREFEKSIMVGGVSVKHEDAGAADSGGNADDIPF